MDTMTMTQAITYDDLERWGACGRDDRYSRDVLDAKLGADWSLTLRDVLLLQGVPAVDRIWVATRPGVLTEDQVTSWMDVMATRAVRTRALHCGVPAVEQWAEHWLSGENRSAWAAARAARAAEAARAAARAAEPARTARAAEAARTAESERQVRDLLGILVA